jgi:hypothetical protein
VLNAGIVGLSAIGILMNHLFSKTRLSTTISSASSQRQDACSFWDSRSVRPVSFCDGAYLAAAVAGKYVKAADVSH